MPMHACNKCLKSLTCFQILFIVILISNLKIMKIFTDSVNYHKFLSVFMISSCTMDLKLQTYIYQGKYFEIPQNPKLKSQITKIKA